LVSSTADPASVESVRAWASGLGNRTAYLIAENSTTEHNDFRYWRESEQALWFQQRCSPPVVIGSQIGGQRNHDAVEQIRYRKRPGVGSLHLRQYQLLDPVELGEHASPVALSAHHQRCLPNSGASVNLLATAPQRRAVIPRSVFENR
jgi:hypothetical protein